MTNKTNYAALAGIDKLTTLVQNQSAMLEIQSRQIKTLEERLSILTPRVEELEAEKSRVDKIEERLQLLDRQLNVIAPLVRNLVVRYWVPYSGHYYQTNLVHLQGALLPL